MKAPSSCAVKSVRSSNHRRIIPRFTLSSFISRGMNSCWRWPQVEFCAVAAQGSTWLAACESLEWRREELLPWSHEELMWSHGQQCYWEGAVWKRANGKVSSWHSSHSHRMTQRSLRQPADSFLSPNLGWCIGGPDVTTVYLNANIHIYTWVGRGGHLTHIGLKVPSPGHTESENSPSVALTTGKAMPGWDTVVTSPALKVWKEYKRGFQWWQTHKPALWACAAKLRGDFTHASEH